MKLDDKVYWWAHEEQKNTGLALPSVNIVNVKEYYIRDDQHTSLFHKEGEGYALLRIKKFTDDKPIYLLVDNYDEVAEISPDLVDMLLKNGLYIYQKAAAKTGDLKIANIDFFQ